MNMDDNTFRSRLTNPVCGDFDMDNNETLLELSDTFCTDTCFECNKETFEILENNVSQLQAWTIPQKSGECEALPVQLSKHSKKPNKAGEWTMDGYKQSSTQPSRHDYKFKHFSDYWKHSEDYRRSQTYTSKAQRDAITSFQNDTPSKDPYYKKLKQIFSAYLEKCYSEPETPLAIAPTKTGVSQAARVSNASNYDISPSPKAATPTYSTPSATASTLVRLGPEYMRFPSMPHRVLSNEGDELQISSLRSHRDSESNKVGTILKGSENEKQMFYPRQPSAVSSAPSRRSSSSSKSNTDDKRRPIDINLTPNVSSYTPPVCLKSNTARHSGSFSSPGSGKTFRNINPYMELYTPTTLLDAMKEQLTGHAKDKYPCRQFLSKKNAKPKKLGATEFSRTASYSHRLSYTQYSPGRLRNSVAVTVHPISSSRM